MGAVQEADSRLQSCNESVELMSKLEALRQKYGFEGGSYEPKSNCKFCHGTGERKTKSVLRPVTFCCCLFIEHSMSDFAGDSLAKLAADLKQEL